ncbi:MAG: phosphatidylserine/phosphatidylglycerophosphate/cardiolipin synthase-like enzyme [Verrucomicrobiales bacterium]
MLELLLNQQIYHRVVQELIPAASRFLWITTADIKDMHVQAGKRYRPFLAVLSELVGQGVAVRLIHAKEPGERFRRDFDRYPDLIESDLFERVLCPRMHTKAIVVDGKWAFIGSANLTGAGLGSKGPHRRNFEAGFLTDDRTSVRAMMEEIDQIYLGEYCRKCQRRAYCPEPLDGGE